jgi:tetratricopeptide (TPR) repeat protein
MAAVPGLKRSRASRHEETPMSAPSSKALLALLLAGLLGACASTPTAIVERPDAPLFADARFGPPTEQISTDRVFEVSDAMRRYLQADIASQLRSEGTKNGLIKALYQKSQLKLEYDARMTKTAAETFATRSGNCLSLVIMTAALARELRLPVYYQSAILDETWSRTGSLLFASGHVNLTLGHRNLDGGVNRDLKSTTIDFLPPEETRGMRTRAIEEETVIAMYANNRAAEALVGGRLDDAYAWAREALRRDPSFMSAFNTLGVVYLRHGDVELASRAFERVLAAEPSNTRALANMAETRDRQGRAVDAAQLRERLAKIESTPPFHFFNLGMAAMKRQDYRSARDYFAREVARADYYHEFHFWLGVADWQLGDVEAARKHLNTAMSNSTTRGQHDLYAAKLDWLQAHTSR